MTVGTPSISGDRHDSLCSLLCGLWKLRLLGRTPSDRRRQAESRRFLTRHPVRIRSAHGGAVSKWSVVLVARACLKRRSAASSQYDPLQTIGQREQSSRLLLRLQSQGATVSWGRIRTRQPGRRLEGRNARVITLRCAPAFFKCHNVLARPLSRCQWEGILCFRTLSQVKSDECVLYAEMT